MLPCNLRAGKLVRCRASGPAASGQTFSIMDSIKSVLTSTVTAGALLATAYPVYKIYIGVEQTGQDVKDLKLQMQGLETKLDNEIKEVETKMEQRFDKLDNQIKEVGNDTVQIRIDYASLRKDMDRIFALFKIK